MRKAISQEMQALLRRYRTIVTCVTYVLSRVKNKCERSHINVRTFTDIE